MFAEVAGDESCEFVLTASDPGSDEKRQIFPFVEIGDRIRARCERKHEEQHADEQD
jgi:hypothetical protein